MDKRSFYEGKTITKIEWWISDGCEFPDLYWGRLRVFSDGTADAAFEESMVYGFDDRDSAGYFLSEDEYIRFETIDEEDAKEIGIVGLEISPPVWRTDEFEFKYLGTY